MRDMHDEIEMSLQIDLISAEELAQMPHEDGHIELVKGSREDP